MMLYRLLHPFLYYSFGAVTWGLRHTPLLNRKTEKLWKTWAIRTIDGAPAFLKVDTGLFKGKKPVWIHAASGEFEYAKPVVRELASVGTPVFVSYFSPTYAANIKAFPGVTASAPLPLDHPRQIKGLIKHIQPSALLITRTDTWPNTVRLTEEQGLPSLLFSATFHSESGRTGAFAKKLTADTMNHLSEIQCVSQDDVRTLREIGVTKPISACGDTRYDQVLKRLETTIDPTSRLQAKLNTITKHIHKNSMIGGSLWQEDLRPFLEASLACQKIVRHTALIVPHEIEETFLRSAEAFAQSKGLSVTRLSRIEAEMQTGAQSRSSNEVFDVLLIDQVGILAELYKLSQIAFVGGSFRKTVHSVMEPLAAGCLTLVGPFHKNNREAIQFQTISLPNRNDNVTLVKSAQNSAELTEQTALFWRVLRDLELRDTDEAS
ncbi:MAG: glycosyltransferase N-terminal domain-containing protein, partial [Bdellovibrionales bacterium]|nr:glycosyltransferase N-terminal domain-containing protein [Bdellovibrionales bacterium]